MKIGLESESMHLWIQNGRMDILGYIDFAKEIGVDGVIINIVKDYGLDENWGALGSDDEKHLLKIKAKLDEYNMYCEIDTKGFEYEKFAKVVRVANILGAKIIRSYTPITDVTKRGVTAAHGAYDDAKITTEFVKENFLACADKIKKLIPLLEQNDIKLAIENHEYEISDELLELVNLVDHKNVGFLFDFGNSMMAWEDPIKACKNLSKKTFSTHCKDLIVFKEDGEYYMCGTPLGEGSLPIKESIEILVKDGLDRINIELTYPYCATFKRPCGTGGVFNLDKAPFIEKEPLFTDLKAMQYYYPQEVSEEALERLLALQKQGCINSVKYIKDLFDGHINC